MDGKFRIQSRAAIQFVKTIYTFSFFIFVVIMMFVWPQWFADHFIYLKPESNDFPPLLHIAASMLGYYPWEVQANHYGKLGWSAIIHNWSVVATTLSMCMGVYNPFASWAGIGTIAMNFPVVFLLGFRAQYCFRFPELTRKGCLFARRWMMFTLTIYFSGLILMTVNSLMNGSGVLFVWLILFWAGIFVWIYDDIRLVMKLREFSTLRYEDADFLSNSNDSGAGDGEQVWIWHFVFMLHLCIFRWQPAITWCRIHVDSTTLIQPLWNR